MPQAGRAQEPLHTVVASDLRRQLAAGRWHAGDVLPSEASLRLRYGVSRSTVRHALADLASAGLVESRPGRGTFVAPVSRTLRRPALGFVVPRLAGMFMAQVLEGMHEAAGAAETGLTVETTGDAPGAEEAALRRLQAAGVFGAAVVPSAGCATPPEAFARLAEEGFGTVFLDCYHPAVALPAVTSDNVGGGRLLARHLLRLGHRRLGCVLSRDARATSVQERLRGILRAVEEAGLDPAGVCVLPVVGAPGDPMEAYARQAADGLLRGRRVTAILCANDDIALHVLGAIREHGLRVPDDVALTGFDDLPFAAMIDPPLTTVRQRAREMGARAVGLLLDVVQHGSSRAEQVRLPVELCIRASAGEHLPAAALGTPPPRGFPAKGVSAAAN